MRKKKTNGSGQGQEAARLPGGAGLNIEKRLSYRFSILSDRMIRAVADMYGPRFGLLLSGWKAMATIGRYSRVSAKDVCAHTTVAPDKITRAVDRLVGLGFVERRRDETDGRRVALSLTPKGAQVYAEIERATRELELSLRSTLSVDELAALDRILDKLESQARTILFERDAWRRFAGRGERMAARRESEENQAQRKVDGQSRKAEIARNALP